MQNPPEQAYSSFYAVIRPPTRTILFLSSPLKSRNLARLFPLPQSLEIFPGWAISTSSCLTSSAASGAVSRLSAASSSSEALVFWP